jgi:hypothetical protein
VRRLRTVERLHVLGGLAGLRVAVGAAVDCLNVSPYPPIAPQQLKLLSKPPAFFCANSSAPMAPISSSLGSLRKAAHSHLLMLLAKLRVGTTGRAATARLATVETARRANISVVW